MLRRPKSAFLTSAFAPLACAVATLATAGCGTVEGLGAGAVQIRIACAAGFSTVGTYGTQDSFCISTTAQTAATLGDAAADCYGRNPSAHLCSTSEWVTACVSGVPTGMATQWEWALEFTDGYGERIGNGGCTTANGSISPLAPLPYRCCYR